VKSAWLGKCEVFSQAGLRLREATQMGFRLCVMPEANIDPSDASQNGPCQFVGVRTVGEALDALLA
jgi:predicted ATP-dependent serine protease